MANISLFWDESINIFATPTVASSTTFTLPNNDASSTVFTGSNIQYDLSGVPISGTINSVSLVLTATSTTLTTITGLNVSFADYGALVNSISDVADLITWSGIVDQNADVLLFTSTHIRLPNLNGTFTDLIGTGLGGQGNALVGNVTAIQHIDTDGTTVLTNVTVGVALDIAAAGIYQGQASGEIYDLINTGSNTMTGVNSNVVVGPDTYFVSMVDGAGDDSIVGSATNNFISYAIAPSAVTVNLLTGQVTGGGGNDTTTNIGGAEGSEFNDILIASNTSFGGNQGTSFFAREGDDTLTGGTMNDFLQGEDGNDTINGGAGADAMSGGAGDDVFVVTTPLTTGDQFNGDAGTDTLRVNGGVSNTSPSGIQSFAATFAPTTLNSIEAITFVGTTANTQASFSTSQLGAGLLATASITGSTFRDSVIFITPGTAGTYAMPTGFVLNSWTPFTYANYATHDSMVLAAGGPNNYTLNGSTGADLIFGGPGVDALNGGDGNDILSGGAGADNYSGGEGDDILFVGNLTVGYTENYSLETFNGGNGLDSLGVTGVVSFNGVLTSVEGIAFSLNGDSTIFASMALFQSLGANAQIIGAANAVQLIVVEGTAGADVMNFSGWTFSAWQAVDTVAIEGGDGGDDIIGTTQNDSLDGYAGDDQLFGGDGDDRIDGWDGRDEIYGEGGNDTLHLFGGETETGEIVDGGAGDDNLILFGNLNTSGVTVIDVENVTAELEQLETLVLMDSDQIGTDFGSAIEFIVDRTFAQPGAFFSLAITYTGASADISGWTFTGWTNVDTVTHSGTASADTMIGGGARDIFSASGGADSMAGGGGDDVYFVDGGDTVIEALNQGTDLVNTALGSYSLGANVENLTYSGVGSFLGIGNALANQMTAGAGAQTIFSGAGADVISLGDGDDGAIAGDGDDTITLGTGADYAYGGEGVDTMSGGAGSDILLGENGNDVLNGGSEQDYLFGLGDNDTLNGDAGVDVLIGDIGDDTLNGGDGDDYLYSGLGADTANGGLGNDLFVMEGGNDIVNGGAGDDFVYGGADNDIINGDDGTDILLGETGNDVITGGLGVDYVFLGSGDDQYVIDKNAAGLNVTVLFDFTAGAGSADTLRLLNTGWTTIAEVQANTFDTGNGYSIIVLDADTQIWAIGLTPAQLATGDVVFV